MTEKLEALASLITDHQGERYARDLPNCTPPEAIIKPGRRWMRIDVGRPGMESGKYMVDLDGTIYGIKAYGVPHLGHRYGTLDTIQEWDWSGYSAVRRPVQEAS